MDFLFDIGNVIIGVDFQPALSKLIPAEVSDPESRFNALIERKDDFEAGRIEPDEYFTWAAEKLGFQGTQEAFLSAWLDIFEPNTIMWSTIEKLHADGHRLILFSNINNPHKDHLIQNHPIFEKFEGGVFSYQTGHIKPEPEIYQLTIDQWQLVPEQTAYIDDLPANIAAGQKAGFLCHQYDVARHDEFLSWLGEIV
ncbi:HAD family phosphatase [Verrucomicrobiaceae bacterium 5K15]|uniref:HAD family phosphatase n=1 Tax=Oceaniferula flava TaxID=2800421 RepID=A0AAE2SDT4_9BACT|nr:HAD family phosphatase [Oceaniferula flavus]MBK1854695.1 HAD family phosphatase [Oceaniferula flavus]MBM1136001.1 HAD family phosphatase [Oceaniferula flavus]